MRRRAVGTIVVGGLVALWSAPAQAHHWDWAYAESGHAMPVGSWDLSSPECQSCVAQNGEQPESPGFQSCINAQITAAQGDPSKTWCKPQPLISRPPNPDASSGACPTAIAGEAEFANQCLPNFTVKMAAISDPAARYAAASCCLQYEIGPHQVAQGKPPQRGYQLTFGPYFMDTSKNDEFTIGYAKLPNQNNLDADSAAAGSPQTYEYMVAFEFWQYKGSHHFIMDDLIGPYNDPSQPRSCALGSDCEKFDQLPGTCPADSHFDGGGNAVSGPRTNPSSPGACSSPSGMAGFPTAGSPGPSYFPVPYPDGVGIKISRNHIFRMTHHVQHWFDPESAQVWINVYTVPAKKRDASNNLVENIEKEAHVFFDGSASAFLIPPHSMATAQGEWIAPRDIELYGVTFHSHKRNILAHADLIGTNGEVKDLPPRTYPHSDPVCGGYAGCSGDDITTCDLQRPPMHLYETTTWSDHESCPYWREDDDANGNSDNDAEGAVIIKQGEGIRYQCLVNNGVLPFQALVGAGVMSKQDAEDQAKARPYTLAAQEVPLQPHDAFGKVVRGKFSCEEIPGVVPGFPGAGAVGYYGNRPCLPDVLKGRDPSEDLSPANPNLAESAQALAAGAPAAECSPADSWHQFWNGSSGAPATFPFAGHYTGKCVPASIGFAETEDDEMCILLGLYAFSDTDKVPSPIDRLPTDVGR